VRLSDLNDLPADRVRLAMIAVGAEAMADAEEVVWRHDAPTFQAFTRLLPGWTGGLAFSEKQQDAVMSAVAMAFCMGATYQAQVGVSGDVH